MAQKNPMSLEDLPGYLKSQRESGSTGSAPVVNMGQIIVPEKPSSFMKWARGVGVAVMMLMAIGVSMYTYDELSTNQITVIVDVEEGLGPQGLSDIVSDSGGKIIAVKHKEDSTYEVEVKTKKSKSSFLDWLLGKNGVKKARLED